MTIKIGPTGYIDLISAWVGPEKKIRAVSFTARGDSGPIAGLHFPYNASKRAVAAVIDVNNGLNYTKNFSDTGSVVGSIHLTQKDTGIAAGEIANHTMWAFIADTGYNA